jgi:futalosine hydrolase
MMRLRERMLKLSRPPRLLVVTAVAAEADAVRRGTVHSGVLLGTPDGEYDAGLAVTVIDGGVGPARAAATTAASVARADERGEPFLAVISAGIAGGFAGRAEPGDVVLGRASVAADLGVQTTDGFLTIDQLGFGSSTVDSDVDLLALLRSALPGIAEGPILTVSTVTGTADRAADLRRRHPDAVAEAMEGYGVGIAATQAGLAFAEIRTISNPIGPRDRDAWRIGDALAALEHVGQTLASLEP